MTPISSLKVVVDHTLPRDELRVHPAALDQLQRALLEVDGIRGFRQAAATPAQTDEER